MNKSLKSLYDDKRWDDFICLASSELENVVDSNDRTEIEFYIAASCMRLGEIDKALVLFRKVLENDKIDKKFLLNSCFNMGIIAHVKGDFEFSFDWAPRRTGIPPDAELVARTRAYLRENEVRHFQLTGERLTFDRAASMVVREVAQSEPALLRSYIDQPGVID